MPALPEAIILVLAPFAPLFSPRVWRPAQVLYELPLKMVHMAASL